VNVSGNDPRPGDFAGAMNLSQYDQNRSRTRQAVTSRQQLGTVTLFHPFGSTIEHGSQTLTKTLNEICRTSGTSRPLNEIVYSGPLRILLTRDEAFTLQ
jgi:hypothetical protein